MPELAQQRERTERELAKKIKASVDRFTPSLVDALGNDSVAALSTTAGALWTPFERALGDDSYWLLLQIYFDAYNSLDDEFDHPFSSRDQAGTVTLPPRDGIVFAPVSQSTYNLADLYARQSSEDLARNYVANTVNRLRRESDAAAAVAVPSSTPTPTTQPSTSPLALPPLKFPHPSELDWDRLAKDILSPGRTEAIAITNTTDGIIKGEGGLVGRVRGELGWVVTLIWHTERDDGVCPICRPLEGTPESYFGPLLGAPPAHPRCRCWLTYRVEYRK